MRAPRTELSVVIPFFNEAENIEPLFAELLPVLDGIAMGYEVVAVDDGSVDDTAKRLESIRVRHGQGVRLVRSPQNEGQSRAFARGFRASKGRFVATLDGDLQIDPRDLPELLRKLDEQSVDLVHGWRRERRDPWLKRVSTRVANAVRNRILRESIRDTGCPLKVFRREVLESLPYFDGMHRFFVSLALRRGFRALEVEVRHRPRHAGRSKYGVRNRAFRALMDCLALRWRQDRGLDEALLPPREATLEPREDGLAAGGPRPQFERPSLKS